MQINTKLNLHIINYLGVSVVPYLDLQRGNLPFQPVLLEHFLLPQAEPSLLLSHCQSEVSRLLLRALQLHVAFSNGRVLRAHLVVVAQQHLVLLQELDATAGDKQVILKIQPGCGGST